MVAEVVIFQEYKSEGSEVVEAKYLFPIDDNGLFPFFLLLLHFTIKQFKIFKY